MSAAGLTADASLRPYEALFEHVELELELAGRGEIEALTAMAGRWESLIGELPATPPGAPPRACSNGRSWCTTAHAWS